ncbi:MAG: hypothetical protein KIT52_19615, partial [Anaerolineae bacterium]|nr:hypothetical protein [Anaerolineae bacterium]
MASLVLKQGGGALARFAVHYQRLASMPRAWRQRLRRKLAVSLSSAALIMALAGPVALPIAAAPTAPEATIVVVNGEVADVHNNKCSLIEAIINARTNKAGQLRADCTAGNLNGPDTVSLPSGGLFELTAAHNEQFGPTGLPVITSAMTIEGNGATIRRSEVSGTPVFRILAVDDAGSLTLRNVVIENGDTGWRFEGPGGYQGGGAILNKNSLTLTGVQVSNSRTWLYGGAIYAEPGSVTTITDSLIATNVVWDDYGEGGGLFLAGQATISGTTITNNTAAYSGGIEVARNGEVTIRDSLVSMNVANADYGGAGGGIGITGVAAIIDSTIADNFAAGGMDYGGYGGGMAVSGVATISGSTIVGNSATSGGEYGPGAPFDGPGEGGGVRVWGTAHISNTTISGNDANRGGGVWSSGELTLTHSTVTGNVGRRQTNEYDGYTDTQPGIGGGLYLTARYATSNVTTLRGAIISGNTADDGGPQVLIDPSPDSDYVPTVNRDAFNVFGQNGNAGLVGLSKGASDIVPSVGLTAILSPLADNGGPTPTHALGEISAALDLIPPGAGGCPATDQRGISRPQRARCDSGAYEMQGAPPACSLPLTAADADQLTHAIVCANRAGAGHHAITLTADITLSGLLPTVDNPEAGEILIEGTGITLAGDAAHTVLTIAPRTTARLHGLTITNGLGSSGKDRQSAGGIDTRGRLTVTDATISGNRAAHGGGVYNRGELTVEESRISDNVAVYGGGGVFNIGALTSRDSSLAGNSATAGGGIAVLAQSVNATVT